MTIISRAIRTSSIESPATNGDEKSNLGAGANGVELEHAESRGDQTETGSEETKEADGGGDGIDPGTENLKQVESVVNINIIRLADNINSINCIIGTLVRPLFVEVAGIDGGNQTQEKEWAGHVADACFLSFPKHIFIRFF